MLIGFGRSLGHPFVLLVLWLVNVVVALPAAWVMTRALHDSFGSSLARDRMLDGFDMEWFGEFKSVAKGLETTFAPFLTGVGAFYENLEAWVGGGLFRGFPGIVGLGLIYGLVWAFLLGGALARFARPDEKPAAARFVQSGAIYFFRFVRLGLLSAPLYYLVYRLHGWLQDGLYTLTRDITVERRVLFYSLLVLALVAFLLALIHVCFACAKVATVVENRRSMVMAALRGVGFVLSHPAQTLGLYFLVALIHAALLALYVVGRLVLRLSLLGGLMAIYERATVAPPAAVDA
jgi:hypothetical protein